MIKTAVFVLMIAAAAAVQGQEMRFPGAEWPRSTPEEQNIDSAKLAAAFDYAGDQRFSQSWCASVVRNGVLVRDEYWVGNEMTPWIVWSVSKAVTNTLLGALERDGALNTLDRACERGVHEWTNGDSHNVTIDHLLRHDSGRYYDFITDFIISQLQPSQTEFAIGLRQQHEIEELYQYNQMAIQVLERVVAATAGIDVNTFTTNELLDVLRFESETYWNEKSIVVPIPNDPLMYGGFWTTCNDLARFGHLWLNVGTWENHTVFTPEYYEKALTDPADRPGRRYHWGGPPNHRANGLGDQLVTFNPEKQLVITRLGDPLALSFSGSTFINMVLDSLIDGKGSYDVAADQRLDGTAPEEVEFRDMLVRMGARTDKTTGQLIVDNNGWGEINLSELGRLLKDGVPLNN